MKSAAILIPLLLPLPALAGGSSTPGQPTTSSVAAALSASRSTASARVSGRVTNNVTVATNVQNNQRSLPGRNGSYGSGSYRSSLPPPDLAAPSISGGNPCSVGASLGGSASGAGGLLGLMWESQSCARRQTAAIIANLGRADVALEVLCRDIEVRYAMAARHTPCAEDRERWIRQGWQEKAATSGGN